MSITTKALKSKRKKFIKEWIEALRNGTYNQTTGTLTRREDGVVGFCCLGVACDLAVKKKMLKAIDAKDYEATYYGNDETEEADYLLPTSLVEFLGLATSDGMFYKKKGRSTLAELNDEHRYSFKQIARVIENGTKPNSKSRLFKEGAL